jgi:hypothetical protein
LFWTVQSPEDALSGDSEASDSCVVTAPRAGHAHSRMSAGCARRLRRQRAAAYQLNTPSGNTACAILENLPSKADAGLSGGAMRNWSSKLSQQLEAGDQNLFDVVEQVRGSVRALAFDAAGCRVLQTLIEKANQQATAILVTELHGSVRRAISSPHANYVIQKIIQMLPARLSRFVSQELKGSGVETSRHRYGCRIVCRLVEHSSEDSATGELIAEILCESSELCRHDFGHYVLEAVLEHGISEQKQRIAVSLEAEAVQHASDRSAAYIIEAALQHCAPADQARLASLFLKQPESLVSLAEAKSSCHVVRALLRIPGHSSEAVRRILQHASDRLQTTACGRRILQELEMDVVTKTA